MVQIGKQAWFSIAASLGTVCYFSSKKPTLNFLGRIDDIAQDIENLQLRDEIWGVIDSTANNLVQVLNYPKDFADMFVIIVTHQIQ